MSSAPHNLHKISIIVQRFSTVECYIEHLFELAALGRKFGAALYGLDSENWRLYALGPENPESCYTISLDRFEII